jgi:hypothetical protein
MPAQPEGQTPAVDAMIDALEPRMIPLSLDKGGPHDPKAFLAKRPDGWTILVTIQDELALFVTQERASRFVEALQLDVQALRRRTEEIEADAARRETAPPEVVAREDAARRLRERALHLEGLLTEIGDLARSAALPDEELAEVLALPEWYLTHVFRGFAHGADGPAEGEEGGRPPA